MNRVSAAKTAFQNPERVTVRIPVVNMTPDKPRQMREDQSEEEKLFTRMIYNRFIAAVDRQLEEEELRCLDHGYRLIREQFSDKEAYMRYSMLWPLFYAGFGAGLDANMIDYAAQR